MRQNTSEKIKYSRKRFYKNSIQVKFLAESIKILNYKNYH